MLKTAKSQSKINATVQIFSSLVQMKFKPVNEKGTQAMATRKEKMGKSKKEFVDLYDPLSMVLQADRKIELEQIRRLKFIASLSADHFIIGNENQIDMISFGAVAHGFVDTDYYWSLSLKGPIQSITVDAKRSIFLILSQSVIYFYRYTIKSKEMPVYISQVTISQSIRFIRFLKEGLLGVFYNTHFEIYNIENLEKIKKKLDKSFQINSEKKLLTIPPAIDNIINVFFQEPKENKQSFILWCLQINFQGEQIKTREPYRVYDIMNYVKGKLSIQNYTKQIIFMNLKNQIMAIKNGYLIDTVNVSVNEQGQILKYIHPQTILHITKKNVEVYNFSINMAVKPEKIVLKSIDSIQICNIPSNAFYITVLQTFNNNFAIFFEDSEKKRNQTRGEITYYFEVSQTTTLKEKISSVFESISQGIYNPEYLEEKYNMAKKMGLSEKEIYLEIWNRSNKSSLADYQYILATRDYKTIKMEIQKKLKKESMVLRQILRIEQGCLDINRQKIESSKCNQQDFQDFVTSHFLMTKLKLYRQINVIERLSSILNSQDSANQGKSLKIDIQHYYFFKNADVKTFLIDQISDMLFNFKNNAKVIRIITKHFKFTYRIIYKDLLEEIIKTSKDQMINLLNEIPEVLPYIHRDLNDEELKSGLYDGIWGEIKPEEWEEALFPQRLENIHNREVMAEFVNSIWFKRYWLTSHDMINKSKKGIVQVNEINNSQKTFYYFISKFYEHTKNNKPYYYEVVNFLQEKYELFPMHLKNKAFLYESLYIYYYHEEMNNPNKFNFAAFLQLDDEHLFKYFFDHQKVKKNSLLKEVKPIYEQSDANGSHIFNIGLFSYFYSDLSKISDLKFILNRINNQKTEFHQKNYGIYEVLVKSMQLKLKLGGENDIPMDQVMIYIQNIPLDRNNEIMAELYVMESIKEEAQRFKEMKINMSVKEIMQSCDLVVGKMLNHQIVKRKIAKITDFDIFREESFLLLEEVEKVKRKIYSEEESNISLLIYLSIILEKEELIESVARLLEDDGLHQLYAFQEKSIENIMLYMYKWCFSRSIKYLNHEIYLKKLMELLPQENECRMFLESQLQLALLLSTPTDPIEYPISKSSACPNIKDIESIFKNLKKQHILNVDPLKCYQLIKRLEKITFGETIKNDELISLHKIYEVYIVGLLEKKLYIESIPFIYKILEIESPVKHVGIIYVILFVYKIVDEFNEESKRCIFKLVALLFYQPILILKIIDHSIKTKLTGLQQTKYLRDIMVKESVVRLNYNPQNPILTSIFRDSSKNVNSKQVVEHYRSHLKSKKQEFQRKNQYDLVFTIMCQAPFLLIKFIDLQREHLNLKALKAFLLAIGYRDAFHPLRTFELLRRVFAVLTVSSKEGKEINYLIGAMQAKNIQEEFPIPKLSKLSELEKTFIAACNVFTKHTTSLKKKFNSENSQRYKRKRGEKMKAILDQPNLVLNDHIEIDQSQDDKNQAKQELFQPFPKAKPTAIPFDCLQQQKILLKRTLPFKQFIIGKDFLIEQKAELQIKSPIKTQQSTLSKDSNYLQIRNSMIQHLYSHRVVTKSEHNDDLQARKEDEDFLDSFLPIKDDSIDLGRKQSNRGSRLNQIDKQKQMNHLVKILDDELKDQHNIQIGNYCSSIPVPPPQPEIPTQDKIQERIKEKLLSTYNETRIPKFQITPLNEHLQSLDENESSEDLSIVKRKREEFLVKFIHFLYNKPTPQILTDLKLIEQIGKRHPESGVNIFFLQAYERIYSTHQKYGLDMNISTILPISGIFIKSKDILDLFHEVEPHIVDKITEENIFKLSKLVALGFRKNIVEQEILFKYSKILMKEFLKTTEEEQGKAYEKIRSLWQKQQTQVLVQKADELFQGLQYGEKRTFLLTNLLESIKNKGYVTASRELALRLGEI